MLGKHGVGGVGRPRGLELLLAALRLVERRGLGGGDRGAVDASPCFAKFRNWEYGIVVRLGAASSRLNRVSTRQPYEHRRHQPLACRSGP